MRVVEVESLEQLDALVRAGATSARGWRLQSVDLTARTDVLARLDVAGAVFLGCRLFPEAEADVRRRGAVLFPTLPDVPFDPYRARLYTADELYAGLEGGYDATLDARAYAWDRGEREVARTLASALHDHAIDDALEEWVDGRSVVGVMGGHAAGRGSDDYRAACRLGHALAARFTVATGGGPGAMEAANLGAYLPPGTDLGQAVDALARVPGFDDVGAWARAALDVRERHEGRESLGVPTWFYGHEPPNVFASAIAKYFANSVREAVLLRVCRAGIVFLPGSAGTVQEIFQAACESYYAAPDDVVALVLVGVEHWTRTLPAWPLLQAQAGASGMAVHLVDDVAEVSALLA
ncbi:LOG family protein [Marmoricola endophyticus]|uniref:LOG family protein n=1 Tax=Marmoricola endophyticus TaxID=2040280 RepID=UPI001E60D2C0|nr:LOG family protein [Marmoricola endophyticus]